MPNFIWPQQYKINPNFGVRLGRLVHWAAALAAIGVLALGAWSGSTGYVAAPALFFLATCTIAALVYSAGRGLRWLLAGE